MGSQVGKSPSLMFENEIAYVLDFYMANSVSFRFLEWTMCTAEAGREGIPYVGGEGKDRWYAVGFVGRSVARSDDGISAMPPSISSLCRCLDPPVLSLEGPQRSGPRGRFPKTA